jgi:hypothetical protein
MNRDFAGALACVETANRRRHDPERFPAVRFRCAISSSANSAWRSSQASPGSWYMRETASPAASRLRMAVITRRLVLAFCSRAQVAVAGRVQRAPELGSSPGRGRCRGRGRLAVGAHQDHEQTLHLVERPVGGPAEGAAIRHCPPWCSNRRSPRYGVRCGLSAGCQQRSHTPPRVALHFLVPRPTSAGRMWCRARWRRAS